MKKMLLCAVACSSFLFGAEQKEVVVTFDPDDLLTEQVDPGVQSFLGLAAGLSFVKSAQLARHSGTFRTAYEEVEPRTPGGVANALRALQPIIREKIDITDYLPQLLEKSVNPRLIEGRADFLRRLREAGHTVLAVTGQDFAHHEVYCRKLEEMGEVFTDLAAAVVVAEYSGSSPDDVPAPTQEGLVDMGGRRFIVHDPHTARDPEWWGVVAAVAQSQLGSHRGWQGVHVDAKEDIASIADTQGNFSGIHFTGDLAKLTQDLRPHGIEVSGTRTKAAGKG